MTELQRIQNMIEEDANYESQTTRIDKETEAPSFIATTRQSFAKTGRSLDQALGIIRNDPFDCFVCGQHGHKQADCWIKAFLDINGLIIKMNEQGWVTITQRTKPLPTNHVNRQKKKWERFLQGSNALKTNIRTVDDINNLLRQHRLPKLELLFKQIQEYGRPIKRKPRLGQEQQNRPNEEQSTHPAPTNWSDSELQQGSSRQENS